MEIRNKNDKHKVVVVKVGQTDVEGMLINHDLRDDGFYTYMEKEFIDAVMNYSKVVDGTCKTLLGVGGNNDECRGILRRTIEDHIDYWYRVQKDGGQTKLDM